jgi:sulfoxide reductase catalytic subunit YedY
MNRRKFLIGATAAACAASLAVRPMAGRFQPNPVLAAGMQLGNLAKSAYFTSEALTPRELVTTYNNFYEFGGSKGDPSRNAGKFHTSLWSVSLEGEVAKPRTFTKDEIVKLAPLEERIYRRSIVVPWIGYSFNALVKLAQPTSKAR